MKSWFRNLGRIFHVFLASVVTVILGW